MAGLIPLLIALTIVETSARSGRAIADPRTLAVWLAVVIGLWWLVCETTTRVLVARAAGRTTGSHRLLMRWDLLAQAIVVGIFAWLCYHLGWARQAVYYSVALAPWAVMQCLHWWCLALPVRRLTGAPWTRWTFVAHQVRFALLPLAIALPVLDLCVLFAKHSGLEAWMSAHNFIQLANVGGALLLALALVGLLPWVLVQLWGAKPLPEGPARDELAAACDRAGVRVAGIMRWPIHGGRVYNAMVMGVLPRLRYVLFTDDLLRDFPADERLAVLGHELGHARYRHLWIYLLFALATAIASWLVRAPLDQLLARAPGAELIDADLRSGLVALVLLGIQWRVLFGWLSRQCERQADLAGAELAGAGDQHGGAMAMQRALSDVARLAGVDPHTPSWRHHSIIERMDFLGLVASDQAVATDHHRQVRRTVLFLASITLALMGVAFLQQR